MAAIPLVSGFLAGLIPPWFKWLALAAILGAVFVGGARFGAGRVQQRWDGERAAHAAQALEASQEAHRIDNRRASVAQEVQTTYAQKQERIARSNAGAAVELDRLRGQLAAISAAASAAETTGRADAERIRVLSRLLAEGAGLASEGRERVERLDARLAGLQGWAEGVCVTP